MSQIVTLDLLRAYIEQNAPPAPPEPAKEPPGRSSTAPNSARASRRAQVRRDDNRINRCRGALNKLPPAVQSDDGSGRTINACRLVWNDFGLDEAEGYPLLQEWNQRCDPPWPEEGTQGLRRKWEEAVKKGPGPEGRGFLLTRDRADWNAARSATPRSPATARDSESDINEALAEVDADPEDGSDGAGQLPDIVHNNRQYRDVEADAARALIAANDPPRVFVGNGCGLIDVQRRDPRSPLAARELDSASLRSVFARVATWFKEKDDGQLVDDYPPPPLLNSFGSIGNWPGIPHLTSIVTYPVFGPGWSLNATSGYHPASGIYCDLGDLVVPPVAEKPTGDDVTTARELLVTEVLGDFPFINQASRANAVAMLILPVIRHAIDGPTPLAMIDAPAQGTGKSLLAEVATLATVGEIPEAMSPDLSDDEWNKTLLAMLIEGKSVVYLDNANKRLDSGALASALTAKFKKGRILGQTKIVEARINVCWIITGNNFECSSEIARRVYWIRIDRGVENPSEYTGYRHDDILEWIRANRPRLLWAILTLCNHWLALGRPAGTATLGKFEAWVATVGGILNAAGIEGLLENSADFRRLSGNQMSEMPEFIAKWYETHASTRVIANDLFSCAEGILDSVLTAKDERGRRTQLGKFLRTQRDKVYGEWRVKFSTTSDGQEDKDHSGRPRYNLERVRVKKKTQIPVFNEYADASGEFDLTA